MAQPIDRPGHDDLTPSPIVKFHRLPGIQILRGVAAMSVLTAHAAVRIRETFPGATWENRGFGIGVYGVDLFFVISGFIIFYTSRTEFGDWSAPARFMMRRIIRIVPLYWLCTFLIVGLQLTGYFLRDNAPLTLTGLGASLFFIPSQWPPLTAGWTLNYEMYFYLIFALLLCLSTPRMAPYWIIGAIVGMIGIGRLFEIDPLPRDESMKAIGQHFLANPIPIEFCYGIAIAWFLGREWSDREHRRIIVVVGIVVSIIWIISIAIISNVTIDKDWHSDIRCIVGGLPAAVLVAAFVEMRYAKGWISALGDASYSLYLTHIFIVFAFSWTLNHVRVGHGLPSTVWLITCIATATLAGVATYSYLERPVTHFLQARWSPRRAVSVAG
jgi:exopolysaccharide production protein ExoZ